MLPLLTAVGKVETHDPFVGLKHRRVDLEGTRVEKYTSGKTR
jgi:hypothetical protein